MTAFLNEDFHSGTTANLQAWHCESCNCVHIRAANVLLTFTLKEFASFVETVVDCHRGASFFGPSLQETKDMPPLPTPVSEVES